MLNLPEDCGIEPKVAEEVLTRPFNPSQNVPRLEKVDTGLTTTDAENGAGSV